VKLTRGAAARRLGVSLATVRRYQESGELPSKWSEEKNCWLFDLADVQRLSDEHKFAEQRGEYQDDPDDAEERRAERESEIRAEEEVRARVRAEIDAERLKKASEEEAAKRRERARAREWGRMSRDLNRRSEIRRAEASGGRKARERVEASHALEDALDLAERYVDEAPDERERKRREAEVMLTLQGVFDD
jgi:hypothetical protein